MRIPEACFKSRTGEVERINSFDVKYTAILHKLNNGGIKISYTRQTTKNNTIVEVMDRSEVEGYDDWVIV